MLDHLQSFVAVLILKFNNKNNIFKKEGRDLVPYLLLFNTINTVFKKMQNAFLKNMLYNISAILKTLINFAFLNV